MRTLVNALVTLSVFILAGCTDNEGDGKQFTAINVKFSFSEDCSTASASASEGLLLMFDREGRAVDSHLIAPRLFYHNSTVTFINADVSTRWVLLLYGEIYDHVRNGSIDSLDTIIESCDGFTARTDQSLFGANSIPAPVPGILLDVTLPVVPLAEGSAMKDFID